MESLGNGNELDNYDQKMTLGTLGSYVTIVRMIYRARSEVDDNRTCLVVEMPM